jgi:hypothetical protein
MIPRNYPSVRGRQGATVMRLTCPSLRLVNLLTALVRAGDLGAVAEVVLDQAQNYANTVHSSETT